MLTPKDCEDLVNNFLVAGVGENGLYAFPQSVIEQYPDQPEKYQMPQAKHALLYLYTDTKYQNNRMDMESVIQPCTHFVKIQFWNRHLRNNEGAIDDIENARKCLMGRDITNYVQFGKARISIFSVKFLEYDPEDSIWIYEMIVALPDEHYQLDALL